MTEPKQQRALEDVCRQAGSQAVLAGLSPYVSEPRKARISEVVAGRMASVEVAVEEPYDPHNAAAVVRSAEALGAGAVHVIGAHERVLKAKRTTTGTFHWIRTNNYPDLESYAEAMRGRGYTLAAACVGESVPLETLPVDRPLCLLFGNEHRGLSERARAISDIRFVIPIYGFAESYNLSVSAAMSLYSVLTRRRQTLGKDGDLEPEDRRFLEALYYLRSVDRRLVEALFPEVDPGEGSGGGRA